VDQEDKIKKRRPYVFGGKKLPLALSQTTKEGLNSKKQSPGIGALSGEREIEKILEFTR
jgi:hypothetical protein